MLYLIFAVIFSIACGYIAKRKNKNTTTAYILGAVLGYCWHFVFI